MKIINVLYYHKNNILNNNILNNNILNNNILNYAPKYFPLPFVKSIKGVFFILVQSALIVLLFIDTTFLVAVLLFMHS
jgi:hypothetical protein